MRLHLRYPIGVALSVQSAGVAPFEVLGQFRDAVEAGIPLGAGFFRKLVQNFLAPARIDRQLHLGDKQAAAIHEEGARHIVGPNAFRVHALKLSVRKIRQSSTTGRKPWKAISLSAPCA